MKTLARAAVAAVSMAVVMGADASAPAGGYTVECRVLSERGIKDTAGPMKRITHAYQQKFRVDPAKGTVVSLIRWDDDAEVEVAVENAVPQVWTLTPNRLLFCLEENGCLNRHQDLEKVRFLSNYGPVEIDLKAGTYRNSEIYVAHLATGAVLSVFTERQGRCSIVAEGAG